MILLIGEKIAFIISFDLGNVKNEGYSTTRNGTFQKITILYYNVNKNNQKYYQFFRSYQLTKPST